MDTMLMYCNNQYKHLIKTYLRQIVFEQMKHGSKKLEVDIR